MYGMAVPAIAEQLHCSVQEASEIRNSFFREFPKVDRWINKTNSDATVNGYVEDVWGRRRRLPEITLPKYEISYKNKMMTFNPLIGSSGVNNQIDPNIINNYLNRLNACKSFKEVNALKEQAKSENLNIKDNGFMIAKAERQCVNARIQGGAASMSKRAMIKVYRNQELRDLGFKLLIAVHDELIGECPEENKEKCKELLSQMMIESALPEVVVPMKCDADDFKAWYLDVYSSEIKKEYQDLLENEAGHSMEKAYELLKRNHVEASEELLKEILGI